MLDFEPGLEGAALDQLVDRAIRALELPEDRSDVTLRTGLKRIAEDWVTGRMMQAISGRPGDQRAWLRQLAKAIAKTTDLMSAIAPEYVAAIAVGDEGSIRFHDVQATLSRLQAQIESFDRSYEPHKGSADIALDQAVRSLISLFQTEGLISPKVRQAREGIDAGLMSKEAVAIGILLQGSASDVDTRTLANKIGEIGKGQKPLVSHLDAIFAAREGRLDASLLPARKGLKS